MNTDDSANLDPEVELSRLIKRAEGATSRPFDFNTFDLLPPMWETAYWRLVMRARTGATESPRKLLEAGGYPFPPADAFENDALILRLWQLFRRLQHLNIFLSTTDHLSDRELYSWLRDKALNEFVVLSPGSPHNYVLIHVISDSSEEDFELWAKYYMDAAEREQWMEENPDDKLPEPCPRPFDRDRFLPCFVPQFDPEENSSDLSWMEEIDDEDEPEDGDEWKRL